MLDLHLNLNLDPRLLLLLVAVALLLWCAISDIKKLRIPNSAVLANLCVAILYGALTPQFNWLMHSGALLVLFAITFLLFHFNLLGGGDVKLISVMGFWTGFAHLLPFLLMMTVAGAVLAVGLAVIKALRGRSKAGENENTEAWRKKAMPYGVAIAVAALAFYAELARALL